MNRLAVVLAADSAATVTQWTGNEVEERYFKGSNKIFQLSDHHPVGLMIFDAADILRVPWEIVVKAFRSELGKKSFNTVREYAAEFFAFLERSSLLFPKSIQDEVMLDTARTAAVLINHYEKYLENDAERLAANLLKIQDRREELEKMPFRSCLNEETMTAAMNTFVKPLIEHIGQFRDSFGKGFPEDMTELATVGMMEIFKQPESHFNTTGLVFAGFGDHEIFPAFAEYKSCGLVCERHVLMEKREEFAITHEVPARLASFAQKSMSETFSLGVSRDVYGSLMQTVSEKLEQFARQMVIDSGGDITKIADFDEVVDRTRSEMGEAILDRAQREHALPLRRVLGVLPVDEMAELAETLINLQALKEKVTKSSETVGGPVDVAIITKNEGLVWVKRKHFFDIGLNSRYLVRQQARLT